MSLTRRHGSRSSVTCRKDVGHPTSLSKRIVHRFKFNLKFHYLNNKLKIWHLALKEWILCMHTCNKKETSLSWDDMYNLS